MKLRLVLMATVIFTVLLAPASALASDIQQTLTVTYTGGALTGDVELYMGSASNLVSLGSFPFTVQGGQDVQVLSILGNVSTAACWIDLDGSLVGVAPVFAYAANTDIAGLTLPSSAPIVEIGMTDGTSAVSSSGELVAFDSPEIIGSWTLTEAPVPEPSSLLLLGTGAIGLLGPIRRKLLPRK